MNDEYKGQMVLQMERIKRVDKPNGKFTYRVWLSDGEDFTSQCLLTDRLSKDISKLTDLPGEHSIVRIRPYTYKKQMIAR